MEAVQLTTEINVELLKKMLEFQKEIMAQLVESVSTENTPASPVQGTLIDIWA